MKLANLFQWLLPVGLLRLSFGDTETTQVQTTTQADNRRVLGNGAVFAEGGASIGITNRTNTYNTTLDASVANTAIYTTSDAAIQNLKESLTFGSDALKKTIGFADTSQSKAFSFGNDSQKKAFALGSDALDSAFSFGSKSLDYSAKSNAQVLDSLQSTESLVATAYNDAKGRGALTDKILIGAIAMAGIVAFAAIRGK